MADIFVTTLHHMALDHENRLNVLAAEQAYTTDAAMWDDIKAAFLAGWSFDHIAWIAGDWPWYLLADKADGRAVVRNGEHRLYVESAAEALVTA